MIEACCALIRNGHEFLAVQHCAKGSHPLQWEFPGGKRISGESRKQCIIREIQEELQVFVEIESELLSVEYDYGSKKIRLIPFVCRIVSGDIELTEHHAMSWFQLNNWEIFDWAAADRKMFMLNYAKLNDLYPETTSQNEEIQWRKQ